MNKRTRPVGDGLGFITPTAKFEQRSVRLLTVMIIAVMILVVTVKVLVISMKLYIAQEVERLETRI